MKSRFPLHLSFFIILLLFVFRSLIFNMTNNLPDWLDYPFVTWVINQNIYQIRHFNFLHFTDANIFYPFTNTLYFSDLFLPQSIIGLIISFITANPITIFNSVFILTYILNYIALYLFWNTIFKNTLLSFLGSLFTIFSPFLFLNQSHFQMLSYWPFFFSLLFLFNMFEKRKYQLAIFSGIFCGIQFLASIYLGIFLLFTIGIYILIKLIFDNKKLESIKVFSLVILSFLLISGVFIKGYLDTKKQYSMTRNPEEFIQYSAHVSDYIFTTPIRSFIHTLPLLKLWNGFDKNTMGGKGSFPGFTLTTLALISLISIKYFKKHININITLNQQNLFFALLIFFGLVFSWGPRINFNGHYAFIPSLYYPLWKFIPFLESIRVVARWNFLFYLGVVYFAISTIQKISQKKHVSLIIGIILSCFLLESLPLYITTHKEEYLNSKYELIANLCKNRELTLLEVPITHFDGNGGIVSGLNRVTKYELSSLYHKCNLTNGYSGYDLPKLITVRDEFYLRLRNNDPVSLLKYLNNSKINILKINAEELPDEMLISYYKIYPIFVKSAGVKEISKDLFLIQN